MHRTHLTIIILFLVTYSQVCIMGLAVPNQAGIERLGNPVEKKIDPLLLEKIHSSKSLYEKIDVIILIDEEYSTTEIDILKSLDIIKRFDIIQGILARISLQDVYNIAETKGIKSIWLDRPELGVPSDNIYYQLRHLIQSSYKNEEISNYTNEVGADELWNKGINGSGSVIAILDSGIDLTGQIGGDLDDFDENLQTYDAKFVGAVSLVPEEPLYYTDFTGRGTFHTGIACGTGNFNQSYKGVAPGASYLNVKVYDSLGLTYWSFLISGIEWSLQHSADIILFCSDIPGIYFDPISLAINKAVEKGITIIVPTGNDGPSYMSVTTPGQALGAISVGAYDTTTNMVANFSGRGPGFDFRIVPDIVAPGVNLIGPRSKILTNESLELLRELNALLNFAGLGIDIDTDIVFNLPNGVFPTPQYGEPVNGNYTKSNGTGAAAAVVAGCVALLIQAFPLANPQLIRTALCDTAEPIFGEFNKEGCGLVNVSAAYDYLYSYFGTNQFTKIPYSAPLLYTGFVSTSDSANWTQSLNSTELTEVNAYDLSAIVSTQLLFDAIIVSNGTDQLDFSQIHLPINQFGFDYEGRVHWLSEFTVLREFHQISTTHIGEDDYNRYLGILELDGLIVTAIVETWNYIADLGPLETISYEDRVNGYKISLRVLNLRDSMELSDLSLVSYFRSDLFVNETGLVTLENTEGIDSILTIGLDDIITFNASTQTMLISDHNNNTEYQYTPDYAIMGFNSTTHQLDSYKIADSVSLFVDLTVNGTLDGYLDNLTSYSIGEEDPGFAMKWNLSENFSYSSILEFSGILSLGLGDSLAHAQNSLFEQMNYLNSKVSFYPIQDIIIAKADLKRMAAKDEFYSSMALILNSGNCVINRSNLIFGANRTTSEGFIEVYSKISSIENFEIQDFQYITQHWIPLEEGIYLTGWVAVIPEFFGLEREDSLLNNILIRNVYIYSISVYHSILRDTFRIYPSRLDVSPMNIRYPGDIGLFNITTYGILPITDVSVSFTPPGDQFMKLMWFGPDIISGILNSTTDNTSTIENFSTYIHTDVLYPYDTVFCVGIGPLFCPPTTIKFNITFTSSSLGGDFFSIPVEMHFEEFRGRIFFDGIHNFLTMDTDFIKLQGEIMNANLTKIIDLEERMDYPYANYYEFLALWGSQIPKGATLQTFFPGITLNMSDYISGLNGIIEGDIESEESKSSLDISFMQELLGGYSFERDYLSTNTIHHDLLQFYDVLIINDPELEILDEEIEDIITWVEAGGCVLMWVENHTENHLSSLNKLAAHANLTISQNSASIGETIINSTSWNSSGSLFPEKDVGPIILQDPVQIMLNHSNWGKATSVELVCEEGYIAVSQLGKGKMFTVGDKDLFGIQGLSKGNNRDFAQLVFEYALGTQFDVEITLSTDPVKLWDLIYFEAEIKNYEDLSRYLEDGILFLSAFMYEDSTIINISFFGFSLPGFVVFPKNASHYLMYYDSSWYNHTGNYYTLFLLDDPAIAQEIVYIPFSVISGEPPPQVNRYEFPLAEYPFWVDMIGIIWIIGMGILIWFYQNEKWKTRLNIIQLKGELLNQAKTRINEGKSILKQILHGIEITKDEQEQIRMILRNRKRVRKYMKELKQFGEKIGEHYD